MASNALVRNHQNGGGTEYDWVSDLRIAYAKANNSLYVYSGSSILGTIVTDWHV